MDTLTTYSDWNTAISRRFFNEANAGKKVFLCIEGGLLDQIGGTNGKSNFVEAVKTGPDNLSRPGRTMCAKALRAFVEWRDGGFDGVPPFLAYLSLFVLAASEEGQHEQQGYYKHLHRLLGEEPTNLYPPGFTRMGVLWEELEKWANETQGGNLGLVCCDFAGAWPHVGRPRAQIVLTERERNKLRELFAAAELDPSAPPAAEEMAQICRRFGSGRLEARTMRKLAREGAFNEEMRLLTVEALLDELRSWDGVASTPEGSSIEYHTLRINLRIRSLLAGSIDSYIAVRDCDSFLDTSILVRDSNGQSDYNVKSAKEGWLILQSKDGKNIDGSSIPWTNSLRLESDNLIFRFPARSVRVFRKGEFDHIEGLIEVNRLDPYREFYVAAAQDCAQEIDDWGKQAGRQWRQINFRSGLPAGWRLFRADSADATISAPGDFPVLNTDSLVRILIQGGVKVEALGRRYFDFAPPTIRIEGLVPGAIISFNNTLHSAETGDITLDLKLSEIALSNHIKVLLSNGEERSASFQTLSAQNLDWRRKGQWATAANGTQLEILDERPRAFGATILSFDAPAITLAPARPADMLGPRPGQLVTIPGDELPTDWTPVWLIEHGRSNRKVIFCGSNLDQCAPLNEPISNRKKVKDWKRLLWNDRMRLNGPTRGPLVALWRQFKEAAEHA